MPPTPPMEDTRSFQLAFGIGLPSEGLISNPDHQAVTEGFHQAGQDACKKQRADRFFRNEAINNHQHRGRDHRRHGAAGGDTTGRNPVVVTELLQFRQRDLAHDGGGSGRCAASRRETGRPENGRDGKAARQVAEPLPRREVEVLGDTGEIGKEAHHDEQRQDEEGVAFEMPEGDHRGQTGGGRIAAQRPQSDETAQCGGECDTHSGKKQDGQAEKRDYPKSDWIHDVYLYLSCRLFGGAFRQKIPTHTR